MEKDIRSVNMLDVEELKQTSHIIKALCEDILKIFAPISFAHSRIDRNNNFILGFSSASWTKIYLDNSLYNYDVNSFALTCPRNNMEIWSQINCGNSFERLYESAYMADRGEGISLVCESKDYFDYFGFVAPNSASHVTEKLIAHEHILKKFTLYYLEKINTERELQKHYSTWYSLENRENINKHYKIPTEQEKQLEGKFNISRLYISEHEYLTKTEFKFLKSLIQDKTVKEIAEENFVSPRTVETHINNIKQKFNVSSVRLLCKAVRTNHYIQLAES